MRLAGSSPRQLCTFCAWKFALEDSYLDPSSRTIRTHFQQIRSKSHRLVSRDYFSALDERHSRSDPKGRTRTRRHAADGGVSRPRVRARVDLFGSEDDESVFLKAVRLNVDSIEKQRDKLWMKLRLGIDEDNPRHAAAAKDWSEKIRSTIKSWQNVVGGRRQEPELYRRLKKAWNESKQMQLASELRFSLSGHIVNDGTTQAEIARQASIADARYPAEWYPVARAQTREIHLHIGPTNSGKTYHALQRLKQVKRGLYAGPLRLLAHEVYRRMLSAGKSCHLVTGDERIISDDPDCALSSSTVEMVPMGVDLDVAVIDEIQMLGDEERGWAWTNVVLGLQAAEIHLCGEARSLDLVRALAASTGEKLIVHEYKRLSPLEVADSGLGGDLNNIQPGDCLVAFSRARIHQLVHQLTPIIPGKVAVVYGSLPPDTRADQARLFNDPDSGYDVVVASNAIGMGLNLNIRRVIFTEVDKFNGIAMKRLAVTDVKQIGGRAGRYRIAPTATASGSRLDIQNPNKTLAASEKRETAGIVTTLEDEHLPFVDASMRREPPALKTAGLRVADEMIAKFAAYFPQSTPLSYIIGRLQEVTRTTSLYHLCVSEEIEIADVIQIVPGLELEERLVFCHSPAEPRNALLRQILVDLATCVATKSDGELLSIRLMPLDVLDEKVKPKTHYLSKLEDLHKALTLYIWLSFRFESIFVSHALAVHTRELTETRISQTLAKLAEAGKLRIRKAEAGAKEDLEDELEVDEPVDVPIEEQAGLEPADAAESEAEPRHTLDSLLSDLVGSSKESNDYKANGDEGANKGESQHESPGEEQSKHGS